MQQEAFSIRPACAEDLETLVAFTLAEAREAEGEDKSPQAVDVGVRTALLDASIARYWVAEDAAGAIVGSISVVREWSDWNGGFYWWIQSVYIQPGIRGQGLIAYLLDHVRAIAREGGALDLRLYVHRKNRRARSAYLREGFAIAPYEIMIAPL